METLQIFQKTPWRQVNREIIGLDFEAMKSFFFKQIPCAVYVNRVKFTSLMK